MNYLTRFRHGVTAFIEAFFVDQSGLKTPLNDFYSDSARLTRYEVFWAFYQGNQYKQLRSWAQSFKSDNDLYNYIRSIYNPTARIAHFYEQRVWRGKTDPLDPKNSGIPFEAEQNVLNATADVLGRSSFDAWKQTIPLRGSVLGDAFMKVRFSGNDMSLMIEPILPQNVIYWRGNILGDCEQYGIEYQVVDPLNRNQYAIYREEAELKNNSVEYRTFRNDVLFNWNDFSANGKWSLPLDFIPMQMIQHHPVGEDSGFSEIFTELAAFTEVDDLASKIHDYIRIQVHPIWMLAGVRKPREGDDPIVKGRGGGSTIDREEIPAFYVGDSNAKPHPLTAPMEIAAANNALQNLYRKLEAAYPELRLTAGLDRTSGDLSGRAVASSRTEATDKCKDRRATYDEGLVRILQKALAVGGRMEKNGYESFSNLMPQDILMSIEDRDVFSKTTLETLQDDQQLLTNAGLAQGLGWPQEVYLERAGLDEETINKIISSAEYQMRLQLAQQAVAMGENSSALTITDNAPYGDETQPGEG